MHSKTMGYSYFSWRTSKSYNWWLNVFWKTKI